MRRLILALVVVFGVLGCAPKKHVNTAWEPSEHGEPAIEYVVQVWISGEWRSLDGTYTAETVYRFQAEVGKTIMTRVAGIDRFGRQGPWSESSELYTVKE